MAAIRPSSLGSTVEVSRTAVSADPWPMAIPCPSHAARVRSKSTIVGNAGARLRSSPNTSRKALGINRPSNSAETRSTRSRSRRNGSAPRLRRASAQRSPRRIRITRFLPRVSVLSAYSPIAWPTLAPGLMKKARSRTVGQERAIAHWRATERLRSPGTDRRHAQMRGESRDRHDSCSCNFRPASACPSVASSPVS